MTRIAVTLATTALLAIGSPAPASKKPCRDENGRIVPCPKPTATPAPRCKDAKGRFVRCDAPGAKPAAERDQIVAIQQHPGLS